MEKNCNINGVRIIPLKKIADERGAVLHMLRSDSPAFSRFGEIYFSEVNPGVVKAWKRHKLMTQHFAAPVGQIRLVIYDSRHQSPTKGEIADLVIGRPDNYDLIIIPPLLWYGFKGISAGPSLLANCADLVHDPEESENMALDDLDISINWQ